MEADEVNGACYECHTVLAGFDPVDDTEELQQAASTRALDRCASNFEERYNCRAHLHCGEDEGYSRSSCSICGCSLAGDRYSIVVLYEVRHDG